MTWTYDPTDISTDLAKVRLLIGDTDTNNQLVTDEEINAAISLTSNVYEAAAWMCRAIVGKYARDIDTSVESVSRKASQRRDSYIKLAQQLESQSVNLGGGLGVPYVGGVSQSAMDAVEDDSDRVSPSFKRGMFNNPPESDINDQDNNA